MEITDEDRRFLAGRARRVRTWPYVGGALLCLAFGLGLWLFVSKPLLANPFVVLSRLESDSIPDSTLTLMAALLPVTVLMCVLLVIAILLFAFSAFALERRYLAMVQRRDGPSAPPKPHA